MRRRFSLISIACAASTCGGRYGCGRDSRLIARSSALEWHGTVTRPFLGVSISHPSNRCSAKCRAAFSLVELAIILVIFGGLAAASTMLGSKWVESTEFQTTRQNIKTLEKAIDAYARLNQRLPCPAPAGVAPTDADFGKDTSDFDGLCSAAALTSGQTVKGVVPFQTLGVGKALAYDAWGNRLDYYVDRRITKEDAMSRDYPVNSTTIGDITVQDLGGGARTSKAVLAVVSFGARAHGAVSRQGAPQIVSDPNAEELENADVNTSGASTGNDNVLVQGMIGTGTDGRPFDDIVSYKLRKDFRTSGVNSIVNCLGDTVDWSEGTSHCIGSVGELADGESVVVSDTAGGQTGSVIVVCNRGALEQHLQSCSGVPLNCSGGVNWTVDAACSDTAGATLHGATVAVINSAGGRTGSATFICDDGALAQSPTPAAVCGLNCGGGTANWSVGAKSCSGTYGGINHGASTTANDSAPVDTGNVGITCTNGSVSQSGPTCSTTGCNSATLNWSNCSASVSGPQSNGYSVGLTNSNGGYTGSATASCNMGAWSLSGTSCYAHCSAQSVNWSVSGQNCTVSVGGMAHGAGSTVTDSVQNSTGSVWVTCNNGTLNQSSPSCVTQCTGTPWGTVAHGGSVTGWNTSGSCGGCVSQTRTCSNGALSGSYGHTSCNNASCASCGLPWGGSIGHGSCATAWNTSASCGSCASQSRCCNNGSLSGSYGYASCNNASCPGCPGGYVYYGSCCQSGVPASPNGTTINVSSWNNGGGACGGGNYGGFGDLVCSMGTWNVINAACWFSGGDGACFAKGTRVMMADGNAKAIEAVTIGDEVKGRGGVNRVIGLKPTRAGDRAIYTINGVLKTTADHPALTDRGWAVISRELYSDRYYGRRMRVVVDDAGTTQERKVKAITPANIREYGVGDRIAFGSDGFVTIESITRESVAADTPLFTLELDGDGTMQLEDGYVYSGLGMRKRK